MLRKWLPLVAVALLAAPVVLSAQEPAALPAASPAVENLPPAPAPIDLEQLFTPKPQPRYGIKDGPCSVQVNCTGCYPTVIQCSGVVRCYWKLQPGGFVECDGRRTTCEASLC